MSQTLKNVVVSPTEKFTLQFYSFGKLVVAGFSLFTEAETINFKAAKSSIFYIKRIKWEPVGERGCL